MSLPLVSYQDVNYQAPLPNGTLLNYTLTMTEVKFIEFATPMIQEMMKEGATAVFLSTAEKLENNFKAWDSKTFTKVTRSKEDEEKLCLVPIVTSIWNKTKTCVEAQINVSKNQEMIDNERHCQQLADEATQNIKKLKGQEGITFTLRQSIWMLHTIKTMREVLYK